MKILSIGNSFSEDATRYFHDVAKAAGEDIESVNLYIGGCSLHRHFQNIRNDAPAYELQYNGMLTRLPYSIKAALLAKEWDYITIQQVSQLSVDADTFVPYVSALTDYIKQYCPKAKILLHQTWGYKPDSQRLCGDLGYEKHSDMFADVKKAYAKIAKVIDADGIIPSGETMCRLVESGCDNTHRDDIHASLGVGRFALALTWYEYFTGNDCENVDFSDFDVDVTDEEIKLAKNAARGVSGMYK